MAGGINIATLFASIGADTSGLQSGLNKAKGSLEDFGSSVVSKIATVATLTAAVSALGQFLYDSATGWAEYGESVYHAANLAGTSTEEMSRLIQAADDFRVSQESLTSAMGMALKNGFVPTIDNLANLADELIAIKDPAERAAKATEIFGRQWENIMPFLMAGGDAIRSTTASISDSLVVSEAGAEQAMEYARQLDELGDAWLGLKMNAGKVVLPIVISILTGINDAASGQALDEHTNTLFRLNHAVEQGIISQDEYFSVMQRVSDGTMSWGEATEYVNGLYFYTNEGIKQWVPIATQAVDVTSAWAEANYDFGSSALDVSSNVHFATESVDGLTKAYKDQKAALEGQLTDAYVKLNVEVQTFRESIAEGLADAVKNSNKSMEEQLKLLGDIDKYFGTKYKLEFEFELAKGGLAEKFLSGTGLDELFPDFSSVWQPLMSDADEAQAKIDEVQAKLAALERDYKINIFVITHGRLPDIPDDWTYTGGGPGAATGLATGGHTLAGMPYIIGERGAELFVPDSNGRIYSNAQTNDILNGRGDGDMAAALARIPSAQDIATAVRDAILMVSA